MEFWSEQEHPSKQLQTIQNISIIREEMLKAVNNSTKIQVQTKPDNCIPYSAYSILLHTKQNPHQIPSNTQQIYRLIAYSQSDKA